jgi:hypothetical protein
MGRLHDARAVLVHIDLDPGAASRHVAGPELDDGARVLGDSLPDEHGRTRHLFISFTLADHERPTGHPSVRHSGTAPADAALPDLAVSAGE